jgi:hypothetical protein
LVAAGELVKSGGDRMEVFEFVQAAFDHVAAGLEAGERPPWLLLRVWVARWSGVGGSPP